MNQAEQASNVIEVWIAMNEDGNYEVGRRDTKCASHPRRKVGRSPIRPNLGLKLAGGCSACAPRGAKRHAQSYRRCSLDRAGRSASARPVCRSPGYHESPVARPMAEARREAPGRHPAAQSRTLLREASSRRSDRRASSLLPDWRTPMRIRPARCLGAGGRTPRSDYLQQRCAQPKSHRHNARDLLHELHRKWISARMIRSPISRATVA